MFWDMVYVTKTANLIYDCNFSAVIFPGADNGAPPLYSIYIAGLWTVFGKSLLICHIAVLPFVLGLLYQYRKLAAGYLKKEYLSAALLLLFFMPVLITQIVFAGYDILLVFLILTALNSIKENKKGLIALSMFLLPVVVGRGFTFLFFLLFADIYINRKEYSSLINIIKRLLLFLPAVILFTAWLFYHFSITGCFMVSAEQWKNLGRLNDFYGIMKNLIYVFWKICDFGMIFLAAPLIYLFLKRERIKDKIRSELLALTALSVISYIVFFLPFSIPVSHRYFMLTGIFIISGFVYFLQSLKKKSLRIMFMAVAVAVLPGGHFLIYPERFGNGWDASLKSLPYFSLKENFDAYTVSSGINPADIGADFPMNADRYDYNPGAGHFAFTDIDTKPFGEHKYIVLSNICNTFSPAETDTLNRKWEMVKEIKSWPVYIRLYENSRKR